MRGAALASSHTPLLAFSKGSTDKNRNATAGGVGIGGPSAFAGSRDKTSGGGEAGGETGGGGEELGGGGGQVKGKDVRDGIDKDGGAVGAKKSKAKEGDENLIVIHVCDENRGINRDFTCRKVLLRVGTPPGCMCLSACLSLSVCFLCWWYVSLSLLPHTRTCVCVCVYPYNIFTISYNMTNTRTHMRMHADERCACPGCFVG